MSRGGQVVRGQQCVSSLSVTIMIVLEPSKAGVHALMPYMANSMRVISCQTALSGSMHNQVDGSKQSMSSGDTMMTSQSLRTLCRAPMCSGRRSLHISELGLRQTLITAARRFCRAGSAKAVGCSPPPPPPKLYPSAGTPQLDVAPSYSLKTRRVSLRPTQRKMMLPRFKILVSCIILRYALF